MSDGSSRHLQHKGVSTLVIADMSCTSFVRHLVSKPLGSSKVGSLRRSSTTAGHVMYDSLPSQVGLLSICCSQGRSYQGWQGQGLLEAAPT